LPSRPSRTAAQSRDKGGSNSFARARGALVPDIGCADSRMTNFREKRIEGRWPGRTRAHRPLTKSGLDVGPLRGGGLIRLAGKPGVRLIVLSLPGLHPLRVAPRGLEVRLPSDCSLVRPVPVSPGFPLKALSGGRFRRLNPGSPRCSAPRCPSARTRSRRTGRLASGAIGRDVTAWGTDCGERSDRRGTVPESCRNPSESFVPRNGEGRRRSSGNGREGKDATAVIPSIGGYPASVAP
jgi:hypothetical protein